MGQPGIVEVLDKLKAMLEYESVTWYVRLDDLCLTREDLLLVVEELGRQSEYNRNLEMMKEIL